MLRISNQGIRYHKTHYGSNNRSTKEIFESLQVYFLSGGDTNTFSHLTIAEINGGLDGLLLGYHAKKESWSSDRRSALTLSQVITTISKQSWLATV